MHAWQQKGLQNIVVTLRHTAYGKRQRQVQLFLFSFGVDIHAKQLRECNFGWQSFPEVVIDS
jgi:hypothetical protein